jgi:hypothetical protein
LSNRSKLLVLVVTLSAVVLTGCARSGETTSVVIPDAGADGGAATSALASALASAAATSGATTSGAAAGPTSGAASGVLGGALASALAGAGGSGAATGASAGASASFTVISPPGEVGAFDLPSGNLGCAVQSDGVRCDILQRTWKPSPKPASCDFDWGQGMVVGPNGADFSCTSDSLIGSGPKVAYGSLVKGSNYACEVTAAGVNCYNLVTRHGFRLSRTAAQIY